VTNARAAAVAGAFVVALVAVGLFAQRRSAPAPAENEPVVRAAPVEPGAPTSRPEPATLSATPAVVALAPPEARGSPDASLDEPALLAELRSLVDVDPVRAHELAQRALRLFPESPDAPEIAALSVKALARQGKRSEARGEAETMVNRYPDSPWAREVERHTGAHPHHDQTSP
jgi:hypothetical protein